MSTDKTRELADALQEMQRRQTENKLDHYRPYAKQLEFHNLGFSKRERALIAGTQLGKTFSAAMEVAMHATGKYPAWFKGKRFDQPTVIIVGGETSALQRDSSQKLELGAMRDGSGAIPKADIIDIKMSRGIADSADTVHVRHVSGGVSMIHFRSYEIGREKWQAITAHVIWLDEEPPFEIYSEALARITATKGIVFCTFTPLKGMSDVVQRYMSETSVDRSYVQMRIEDASHISPEERERIVSGYAEHEREARSRGIPMLGEGAVFTFPDSAIAIEPPNHLAPHFVHICGVDFGVAHPFAWVHLAWDRDNDCVLLVDCFRIKDANAATHVAAIAARNCSTLVHAWPHDGLARDKGSGEALAGQYKKLGLNMCATHAQWAATQHSSSVEAGIMEIIDRATTNRFKVASNLSDWFQEKGMLHRKNGQLVKEREDLISATRYALMMLRFARPANRAGAQGGRTGSRQQFAGGLQLQWMRR